MMDKPKLEKEIIRRCRLFSREIDGLLLGVDFAVLIYYDQLIGQDFVLEIKIDKLFKPDQKLF